jgi:hypothetical protein
VRRQGAAPGQRPATPAERGPATLTGRPRSQPTGSGRESRTHFVFLVVGLLGGGLLCLLLINTVLATGSFQISSLQQGNVALAQQEQALKASIAAQESPSALARSARRLGMAEPSLLHFLDLARHRVDSEPARMPGIPAVPGYTP